MSKKLKLWIIVSSILLVFFIGFTCAVKFIDVQAVGEAGSKVGFAFVNEPFMKAIGQSETWLKVSEIFGLMGIALAGCLIVLGIVQWVQRKSIKKVDYQIFDLATLYSIMIVLYLLFEIVVVNKRPILVEGKLEASYPSSHTLLSICIFGSAIQMINYLISNKKIKVVLNCLCVICMTFVVVGRMLSGVHWFTDIIGSVILGCVLLSIFNVMLTSKNANNNKK